MAILRFQKPVPIIAQQRNIGTAVFRVGVCDNNRSHILFFSTFQLVLTARRVWKHLDCV